jgi:ribosomal protein S18 acetylase RimI-like enzyme
MPDQPLLTANDEQLIDAVSENLHDLFRAMVARLPGSHLKEHQSLARHLSAPTNPMFKGVRRTRLTPDQAEAAIVETIAWFKEHQASFFFWWTDTNTTPVDLGERLMKHGLVSMEGQAKEFTPGIKSTEVGAPCMIADLRTMNETALNQVPAGFTIDEVRSESDLQSFKQVLIAGYDMPDWAADGWIQAAHAIGIGRTPWQMYLGRLNGEPVATNMLFNGGGVASVYGVATVPAARGQGIGGAITLRPLLDAREQGYRYAVLFASDMGVHTYERIGFRLTSARLNRYLWRATS